MSETATENTNSTTETTSTKGKTKKTARPKAAAPKAKPPTAAKPKREKKPKVPLCTFAIRLRVEERDEIHKAAGARNATQFVKAVALAAARGDDAAYREAIEIARKLQ